MIATRIIPCLLLRGNGLVKTIKFKDPTYIGDPINAVRIFSEKEVDEIVILDIDASRKNLEPNYELIAEIAGECFMPMAYGGGVRTLEQVRRLVRCGVEKIVINSAATESTKLITEAAQVFGSQAIVAAVDVKRTIFNSFRVAAKSATIDTKLKLEAHLANLVAAGAGEIFINSVDRDGTMAGFDLDLIQLVSKNVKVPVVACGGAGNIEHLREARIAGATAVSAGSMFIFHGKHKAVLISYPDTLRL
jgi:cyclase